MTIKRTNIVFIIILLIFLGNELSLFAQIYYTPEKTLLFANHLYHERDYLRAATEYMRFLHMVPTLPQNVKELYFRIGDCFRLGGVYKKAQDYYRKVVEEVPENILSEKARLYIGYSEFLNGNYSQSMEEIKKHISFIHNDEIKQKYRFLEASNHFHLRNWTQGKELLNNIILGQGSYQTRSSVQEILQEIDSARYKNRVLAAFLSTVFPGMGKIYAGRTWDGVVSLLSVGLPAYQSYRSFMNEGGSSSQGWIFGAISAFFYVGNIYGTVIAVDIYNESTNRNILEKTGIAIRVIIH